MKRMVLDNGRWFDADEAKAWTADVNLDEDGDPRIRETLWQTRFAAYVLERHDYDYVAVNIDLDDEPEFERSLGERLSIAFVTDDEAAAWMLRTNQANPPEELNGAIGALEV